MVPAENGGSQIFFHSNIPSGSRSISFPPRLTLLIEPPLGDKAVSNFYLSNLFIANLSFPAKIMNYGSMLSSFRFYFL